MPIKKPLLFVAVLLVISLPVLAQDKIPISAQTAPYLTLETTLQTGLAQDFWTIRTFAATPDGQYLFWYDSAQILRLNTTTGEKTVLKDLPNNNVVLATSPDSRQLAVLIFNEVYVADIDELTPETFDASQIPHTVWALEINDYPVHLSYAPDGALLLVNTNGAVQRMAPELVALWRTFAPQGTSWSVSYDYAPNRLMLAGSNLFIVSPEGDVTVCKSANQGDFSQPTLAEAVCAERLSADGKQALKLVATIPNAKLVYQHPTQRLVAVGLGEDDKVIFLDAETGATQRELDYTQLMPDTAFFSQMAFSPDGVFLVIAGMGEVSVWDVATGAVVYNIKPLIPADSPIGTDLVFWDTFAFNADGRLLALAEANPTDQTGKIVLYDLQARERLAEVPASATFMAFSGDDTRLLTLGDEAQVWQVAPDAVVQVAETPAEQAAEVTPLKSIKGADLIADFKIGSHGCVFVCAFNHAGTLVVLDAGNFDMRVWEVATGKELWRLGDVQQVAFSPDDQTLYALTFDGLQLYNARSGAVKNSLLPGTVYPNLFALHPDGRVAFLGQNGETGLYGIDLWQTTSGVLEATVNAIDDITWINNASFSPDGNFLVVSGEAGEGYLTAVINTQTWERVGTLADGWLDHHYSADGALLVPEGNELVHYDLATLKPIQKQPLPPKVREISGGARLLGIQETETSAEVYDIDSGALLATLTTEAPFDKAFVDSSERYVLVLSNVTEEQMRLEIWRIQ